MSADPNRLLFVLSARHRTTWSQYCEAVDLLSGEVSLTRKEAGVTASRSYLLQSFQALGHCDAVYNEAGSAICIVPPSLCRLAKSGLPQAVLTGARAPETWQQLHEFAAATGGEVQVRPLRHPGALGLLPDTILVEAISEQALTSFSNNLGITYADIPPAWVLVNWCGTLPEMERQLDYRHPDSLNWPRFDYSTEALAFARTRQDSLPRFTRYRNPTTGLPLHVFFRDDRGAEIDLCWGRYLLFKETGLDVTAYDERRFRLCVPVEVPLPAIIARVVCLCSGQPPTHLRRQGLVSGVDCSDWLVFEAVPPQIAMEALSKVGQRPTTRSIEE